MKQRLVYLLLTSLCIQNASAQLSRIGDLRKRLAFQNTDTVAWIYSGTGSLGINEGVLHNWAAGGEIASLNVTSIASAQLTRLNHNRVWTNNLDATYSLYYAYSNGFVPRKIDDRIDFTSRYGVRLDTAKNFYVTGLFNFKSQFTKGYNYDAEDWAGHPVSDFLSPAYFTLAMGLEYRTGTAVSFFLSPLAARLTTASPQYTRVAPEGAYGIAYGKTTHFELGAYFSGRYIHDFSKTVSFKTRLDLYTNYLAKDEKDGPGNVISHDNPGNVDVLLDNLVSVKLGKYFSLTAGITAIYDNDLPYRDYTLDAAGNRVPKDEPASGLGWWQIKQTLTFGLAYTF